METLHGDLISYFEEDGTAGTCWIPREQGPDISLMTEVVDKLHRMGLFRARTSTSLRRDHDPFKRLNSDNAVLSKRRRSTLKPIACDRMSLDGSPMRGITEESMS